MEKQEAIQIVQVPVKDLKPSEYNPRMASEKEVKELTDSITKFGLVDPIIVNSSKSRKNIVIGGHFRLRVATEMGFTEMPVVYVNIPELAKERELNLRLNFNSGSFDYDLLANFDEDMLIDVGFSSVDIDKIFQLDIKPEDDEIPENPPARSKMGNIYKLGKHRVMCGDSTKREDVDKLMDGKKADICFTSPPYWVGFEYENEKDKEGILEHIEKATRVITSVSKKIFINTGNISSIEKAEKITGKRQPALLIDWWIDAMNRNNYLLRHIRIWAKMGGVMPSRRNDKIDMHWEYIATFTDEGGNAGFIASFYDANIDPTQNIGTPKWAVKGVWADIQGKARQSGHVAAFPVELANRYILMYSERNGILYEPYCGSGSTLIACEKTNRICYGMEIDPHYCDVVVNRWEQYTGQKAEVLNG